MSGLIPVTVTDVAVNFTVAPRSGPLGAAPTIVTPDVLSNDRKNDPI